ncbi:MAG: 16S rRNA (uracil(1498)-N(3))-methyltransferase [Deltaproteobacteria bacterium]|nr:16S rRNA (uracil(1498)-N(3))-methyltransferase [Deltaproteobacteria bacterium]
MNLLLLSPDELRPDGTATLTGRRLLHAREILKAQPGDTLRCGVLGGLTGTGTIVSLTEDALALSLSLTEPPPPRAQVDLLLAMPRPKALKRLLPQFAQLGIDRVVLLNAARVEKSYFSSPALHADTQRELLVQGLEQAKDTRLPEVLVRERFKPFVEDELDAMFPQHERLVAHPHTLALTPTQTPTPTQTQTQTPTQTPTPAPTRVLLAIGPEGGWVPFELELLAAHRFTAWSAGPRILRTETAVPFLLGMLSAHAGGPR